MKNVGLLLNGPKFTDYASRLPWKDIFLEQGKFYTATYHTDFLTKRQQPDDTDNWQKSTAFLKIPNHKSLIIVSKGIMKMVS